MTLVDRLAVARGDKPADLVLKNAQLINVISGEIYKTDVVISGNYVVALGNGYQGNQEIDLNGNYLSPGFIDAHVHIESSLLTPPEFARVVLPHGVTTVITDPHEIANVLGIDGIHYMLHRARQNPMSMFVMVSSCVPATTMETGGASLEAEDIAPLLNHKWVTGLAEVMNYPGVAFGDEGMLDKITLFADKILDGHAPGMSGKMLNAYVSAGIQSEHECTTVEEAREKLRAGLTIFIREGTATRNLLPLLPLITPENHSHICFCTDDRVPASLLDDGSIDYMIRIAIENGIDPITAIRMGTINTARYFGLKKHGAIVPGRYADMVVFSDLDNIQPEMVFRSGKLVAQNGTMTLERVNNATVKLRDTMNVRLESLDFTIPAVSEKIRVIGVVRDQIITDHFIEDARIVDGEAIADIDHDILKFAIVERHHATGNIGKGFIKGFGLKRGAIAGSVAHDHHNLTVIGTNDADMKTAIMAVIEMGGGLVVVDGDEIIAQLPLPVAGLMSDDPVDIVRAGYDALINATHALGSTLADPFMTMSFMGLEVIPKLKLTDKGLVDVEKFDFVEPFV